MKNKIENIYKRDFSNNPFQLEKITDAILKAMVSVGKGDVKAAEKISLEIYDILLDRKEKSPNYVPNVEEIQDLVEQKLMKSEFLDAAKAYILYRNKQAEKRQRNMFEKRINLNRRVSLRRHVF